MGRYLCPPFYAFMVCTWTISVLTFMHSNVFCLVSSRFAFWGGFHSEFCKQLRFLTSGLHVQATWTVFTLYNVTLLAMEHPVLLGCFVSRRSEHFLFSLFWNAGTVLASWFRSGDILMIKEHVVCFLLVDSLDSFWKHTRWISGLLECYSVSTGK
jgi:hypothetical protein